MSRSKTLENLISLYEHHDTGYSKKTSIKVAKRVSACDREKTWKWRYMVSLKNETVRFRPRVSKAINKAFSRLKPPRIVSPDTVTIRTLKIMSDEYQLHEIQERFKTHERTERLLA